MNAPQTDILRPYVSPEALEKLELYTAELIKWNRRFSFTSVPDDRVFIDLIAPSAWLGAMYGQEDIGVVADFGTGPGLPGVPMAIADGKNRYLLVDSAGKKTGFIRHCVRLLGLVNITVMETRLSAETKIEPVDRLVSRAAGEMAQVVSLWNGKIKPGALADFFKGSDLKEETQGIQLQNPAVKVETLETPDWFGGLKVARVRGAFG